MQHIHDEGRRSRLDPVLNRERAASQPPTDSLSTRIELAQRRFESNLGASGTPPPSHNTSPWSSSSRQPSFSLMSQPPVIPRHPTRSLSFSTSSDLPSRFHPFSREAFPSTFEDDEDDEASSVFSGHTAPGQSTDLYEYTHPARGTRAATLALGDGLNRSRSQSLAAVNRRQLPIGYGGTLPTPNSAGFQSNWGTERSPHASSFNGASGRYDSLLSSSSVGTGHSIGPSAIQRGIPGNTDLSNMSPFVRDVSQILDDNAAFRELWVNSGLREDGGGSGTTSRRHSVSVVQPRRGIIGFTAPGDDDVSPSFGNVDALSGSVHGLGRFGLNQGNGSARGRGTMISDDELAGDLNSLSLNFDDRSKPSGMEPIGSSSFRQASLPTYGLPSQYQQGHSPGDRVSTPTSASYAQTTTPSPGMNLPSHREMGTLRTSPNRHVRGTSPSRPIGSEVGLGQSPVRSTTGLGNQQSLYLQTSNENRQGIPYRGGNPPVSPINNIHSQGTRVQQQQGYTNGQTRPLQQSGMGMNANARGATGGYFAPENDVGGLSGRALYGFSSGTAPLSPNGVPSGNFQRSASVGSGIPTLPQAQATNGIYPPRSPTHAYPGGQVMGHHANPVSVTSPTTPGSANSLSELGRGVPLHSIAASTPLFIVEFKAGRSDLFFCADPGLNNQIRVGDLVIVEADRGKDLGKVVNAGITGEEVERFQRMQIQNQLAMQAQGLIPGGGGEDGEIGQPGSPTTPSGSISKSGFSTKELMPKRIYAKAQPQDTQLLLSKMQDEQKALQLCQTKVRAKKLPMEVVDAEYQWDRRKLTFYFVADRRIDFRELVRELFRLYKTRIWMACLQGPTSLESGV
ncbi:hypothetical protein FRC03_005137 [Tulasnella sp. 419]|nr:hypothetical protein FRC03_005137 [Tulasnella sp. 419]